MKLKLRTAVLATTVAAALGVVGLAGPAEAATQVDKSVCTLTTRAPFWDSHQRLVGATAVVYCSSTRSVWLNQEMDESDGSSGQRIGYKNSSGWTSIPGGTSRGFTIYTSCVNTESGAEEYYQAGRFAVSGYQSNSYSPWAASQTSSMAC